jgi:hypothetical protein
MKFALSLALIAGLLAALWFAFPHVLYWSWGAFGFPVAMIAIAIAVALTLALATFLWRWARTSS